MELFPPFSSCRGKLSRPADTLLFVMSDLEMKGTNTKQITETFHTSSSNPCSELFCSALPIIRRGESAHIFFTGGTKSSAVTG